MNKLRGFNTGILLIIATTLFISGNLLAQQQQNRNSPPKPPSAIEVNKIIDDLSKALSLNESQKKEVSDLFMNHFNEIRKSVESKEEKVSREQMESKRRRFEEQVKSLLNDAQKIEFDKFMRSHGPQPNQQQQKR